MSSNQFVSIEQDQAIAWINIDYPPVNALSQPVRQGILEAIESLEADDSVQAIVIHCVGKTFIAGADIKEFGKPPTEPMLPDVVNRIAACNKPVIAALHGTVLGGGLEVALAAHQRVALADTKVGLPEVNLGLIPGAGGTQRLPKIVGISKAIEMVTSGKHYPAKRLADSGLFNALFQTKDPADKPADLKQQTRDYVMQFIASANNELLEQIEIAEQTETETNHQTDSSAIKADQSVDWDALEAAVTKKARGVDAPVVAFHVIKQTHAMDVLKGMKIEREAFLKLRDSEQSAALRHAFAAEKQCAKFASDATPLTVNSIGIIGGGTMGSGIATACLLAGFDVTLIEQSTEAANTAKERIDGNLQANVKRGAMTNEQCQKTLARLTATDNKQQLANIDLIIEAVFEDIEIKKSLFAELDGICKSDCIFATNTSYLDINAIATASNRADKVVGMHFFSPAHIMKLLEVVNAKATSDEAIVTALAVGKRLRKIAVCVGVCFGFAGNRMYTRYGREVQQMLLEGAGIAQIDNAMKAFGMAMGPLAVQDLSGIDIGHNARSAQPFPKHDPGYFRAAATMVEHGRLGRKTGKGFYNYQDKQMLEDPEAAQLIRNKADELGIEQREFTADEISERAILALISEGLALYNEGIVQRLSDIDVIWLSGYGFPRYKGGPMFLAKRMGIDTVKQNLDNYRAQTSELIWPEVDLSPLAD